LTTTILRIAAGISEDESFIISLVVLMTPNGYFRGLLSHRLLALGCWWLGKEPTMKSPSEQGHNHMRHDWGD
jgi:hypothetical protein